MRWVLLAVLPACLSGQQPASNPMAGKANEIDLGRNIFRIYCSPCHGIRAGGGRGPDLTRGTFANGDADADVFRVISQGVSGTEMQAFAGIFDDDNIWRLVAYIRSAAKRDAAAVAGDRAAGEKLFWEKGACGQCHTVGARGRPFGPDLTRVGRQRSLAYLRESVLDPNADITPGYATISVRTRAGETVTGVQRGFDNFSAQLLDAGGRYHSFEKSEVESARREDRSLMPDRYGKLFSEPELTDLLAYLSTLRGEEAAK